MQASTPVLTPRKRLLRACLKWLLVALVSVWTVVASVYLLIHAVIVPRIDTWRSQAQQQLSSALGAPVRIGSLSGKANNWTSYFEMRDVVVGSNAQAPDLLIPKLEASLSMRGLWRLSFDQVRITSPSVQVQRTASGAWRVAGVALPSGPAQATPFWLDWLFEQPELLVLDGQAAVRDDWAVQAAPATWSFRNIDVALRSGTTSHDARIDFTPPPEWGQRVSVQAQFESPLFSSHGGDWREWSGQAYAQWPQLDAAVIHRALDRFWPTLSRTLSLDAGEMAWRGWLEWRRGMQLQALTSDVALTGVSGAWLQGQPELKPLRFKELLARLSLTNNVQTQQWELGVSDMSFETQDGVTWRDAQLALAWPKSAQDPNAQGRVRVSGVDLTALRQIMPSLPLPQVVRDYLQGWRPQGFVNRFQADWRGALDSTTPLSWHTSGQATQLGWSEGVLAHDPADTAGHGALARPGVSGLSLTWDGTAEGGTAQLSMDKGAWVLPGVWLEPRLDVNSMQAALSWAAPRQALDAAPAPASWAHTDWQALWRVSFDDLRLDTPDGVVSGAGVWAVDPEQVHTDAAGYLRLSAKVDELALPKLGRYLPVSMNADAVSFVRQRLQAGVLRNVSVRINSLLDQSLWLGGDKRFAVEAQAQGVALDYAGGWGADQRWPALATLSGAFAMRGLDIDVSNIKGRLRDATSVVISDASVSLRHLDQDAQLKVQARAAGPLATWLAQLNTTPVQRWTNGLMRDWVGDGDARLNLSLAVPLATPERTTVQGEVTLAGNRVQLWPGVPALQQTQARVRFTDTAVSVDQASAQWLGGPIKGQMQWAASGAAGQPGELRVDVSGNLNANALARTPSLGTVAMLAQRASGSTPFDVSVRGTPHGIGWRFNAPLDGVRLDLPAPLNKPSGQSWPLSVALRPLLPGERSPNMAFGHDIQLRVGPTASPIVSAHFVREYDQALTHITNQTVPSAVRGVVGLGQFDSDALSLPSEGVVADVRLAHFNMDSWRQALADPATHTAGPSLVPLMATDAAGVGDAANAQSTTSAPSAPSATSTPDTAAPKAAASDPTATPVGLDVPAREAQVSAMAQAYLPTTLVARALSFTTQGREFHNVVLGGSREGARWRANILADEINGYVQYRASEATGDTTSGSAGSVYARLAMLTLAKQETQDIVAMLTEQPSAMPALDVVVDALNLDGRDLGRLELQAFNRVVSRAGGPPLNEWRLNRLWLDVPEASLRANGQWAPVVPTDGQPIDPSKRRTFLDFDLNLSDSGALLARFGMPGVVRGAQGQMKGQVAWLGAPTNFDTRSLNGGLDVKVANGQFLKADPGIARLVGVLSLQSLPRRLLLDFRDVFLEGFAFDSVTGAARIANGVVSTNNMRMAGVSATVLMEGQASMVDETQALQVVVVPQVDAGTLSLVAASANPVIGVATYFLERVFGQAINTANTKAFQVSGSWQDPQVEEVSLAPSRSKAPVQTIDVPPAAKPGVKPAGAAAATVSSQPAARDKVSARLGDVPDVPSAPNAPDAPPLLPVLPVPPEVVR